VEGAQVDPDMNPEAVDRSAEIRMDLESSGGHRSPSTGRASVIVAAVAGRNRGTTGTGHSGQALKVEIGVVGNAPGAAAVVAAVAAAEEEEEEVPLVSKASAQGRHSGGC
jgi:hypothetical protein